MMQVANNLFKGSYLFQAKINTHTVTVQISNLFIKNNNYNDEF